MKHLKKFNENFDNSSSLIPQEIIDALHSTDHRDIIETLETLQQEISGDGDISKLRAYVDDIGVYLDDTGMDVKEADDIYFRLMNIVNRYEFDKFPYISQQTEDDVQKLKAEINEMSHEELANLWRHGSSDNKLLQGEVGEYFKDRLFKHFGGFNPSLSKKIGWQK